MKFRDLLALLLVLAMGSIVFVLFDAKPKLEGGTLNGGDSGNGVPSATRQVKVYFSNSALDPEASCDFVVAVTREVADTPAIARAALTELLKGPTAKEEKQGYFTSINPGVMIRSIAIADGTAKVDFDGTIEKEVGGSCRVAAIRKQIEQTLLQFPTIKSVVISVEGRIEEALQP